MRLIAISLAVLAMACGDDASSEPSEALDSSMAGSGGEPSGMLDSGPQDSGMMDATTTPERNGTTAPECYAGIVPLPDDGSSMFGPPHVEIARFASDDDTYQIVRARERDGRWIGGWTINYRVSRFWIEGGPEDGTCVTDHAATTYTTTHHNFDDSYTVTTARASYAFHEVFDILNPDTEWTGTLEVRDASGAVLGGPLSLRKLCEGDVVEGAQGEVPCTTEPLTDSDAGP